MNSAIVIIIFTLLGVLQTANEINLNFKKRVNLVSCII